MPFTFESVFNGRDLTGWKHEDNWMVKNGEIVCVERGGNLTYRAARMPDNFELWFEWMVAKGSEEDITRSPQESMPDGLFSLTYRAIPKTDLTHGQNKLTFSGEIAFGYSVGGGGCVTLSSDVISLPEIGESTSSLFYTVAPSKKASRLVEQWNEGRIVRKGNVIQHWLNGEKVMDIDLNSPFQPQENERLRVLAAKLGSHGLYLQFKDDTGSLRFRNVKLKRLSRPVHTIAESDVIAPVGPPELGVAVVVDGHTLELRRFVERMVTRTTTSSLPPGVKAEVKEGAIGPTSSTEVVPVVETQIARVDATKVVARRVDGRAVSSKVLMEELARLTPVIFVKQGQQVDPLFSKMFKPEALVLLSSSSTTPPPAVVPGFTTPANQPQ